MNESLSLAMHWGKGWTMIFGAQEVDFMHARAAAAASLDIDLCDGLAVPGKTRFGEAYQGDHLELLKFHPFQ